MTTIEPGVVERLVERLLRKCDGTNDSDAATMAEAATLLAQQQARIGEMKGDLVAAREISVIIERRASAGDDRIRRLEGAIQAMAAAIRPLRDQGEDYIWRPAARVLELADNAILDRALAAKDQP